MRNPYHKPRKAYCTGCGVTFPKMHVMINHRRLCRCGGRFLPVKERQAIFARKYTLQAFEATNDWEYLRSHQYYHVELSRMRHDRIQATRQSGGERVQNAQAAARG